MQQGDVELKPFELLHEVYEGDFPPCKYKIYIIYVEGSNMAYIGKTMQSMDRRFYCHIGEYLSEANKPKCTSRHIMKKCDELYGVDNLRKYVKCILIDSCESKVEATEIELDHIEIYKAVGRCVNKRLPNVKQTNTGSRGTSDNRRKYYQTRTIKSGGIPKNPLPELIQKYWSTSSTSSSQESE